MSVAQMVVGFLEAVEHVSMKVAVEEWVGIFMEDFGGSDIWKSTLDVQAVANASRGLLQLEKLGVICIRDIVSGHLEAIRPSLLEGEPAAEL